MRLGNAWRKAPRPWIDKRRYVHDRGKVNEIVHAFFFAYSMGRNVFPYSL